MHFIHQVSPQSSSCDLKNWSRSVWHFHCIWDADIRVVLSYKLPYHHLVTRETYAVKSEEHDCVPPVVALMTSCTSLCESLAACTCGFQVCPSSFRRIEISRSPSRSDAKCGTSITTGLQSHRHSVHLPNALRFCFSKRPLSFVKISSRPTRKYALSWADRRASWWYNNIGLQCDSSNARHPLLPIEFLTAAVSAHIQRLSSHTDC